MAKKIYKNECVFCKLVSGELKPARVRYEDDDVLAFDDINPLAPIHVQVITKKHIESLDKMKKSEQELMGKALYVCRTLAKELGIAKNGYRVVTNVGKWSGQVVPHIHFHLLGGAPLTGDFAMNATEVTVDAKLAKKV